MAQTVINWLYNVLAKCYILQCTVKLLIQARSPIQAGLEMGVDEIDESEDENNVVLIDADDAD